MTNIEMRDIKGFEGKYAVTADGRVWSYWANGFIATPDNGQGYLFVGMSKDGKLYKRRVHRLVAEAFVPKPDGWTPGMPLDVGHKNDIRNDNRAENLFWCTRSENLNTDSFREKQKVKVRSKVRCVETG